MPNFPMDMSPNMEDYLESIYLIHKSGNVVRTKELAKKLNVRLPSVTEAVKKLSKKNMLNYKRYGNIIITKKGEETAKKIYKKHKILYKFFVDVLGIDKNTAEDDACKIEHIISKNTADKLKKFVENR